MGYFPHEYSTLDLVNNTQPCNLMRHFSVMERDLYKNELLFNLYMVIMRVYYYGI